ncbi:MAG: hypothetical protein L6R41_000361 [Letrouitia leprolyta]|nr:MAG: hypothetical protein L6R41_000361 [Letrouitia leprolyta]
MPQSPPLPQPQNSREWSFFAPREDLLRVGMDTARQQQQQPASTPIKFQLPPLPSQPKISHWGFSAPREDLLRIEINTTRQQQQQQPSPTSTKFQSPPLPSHPKDFPREEEQHQRDTAPILTENQNPGVLLGAKIELF